jgi:glycosyltransferase involved in cell wall biosynthesis
VIPCFNESLNLAPLLTSFLEFEKKHSFEVIIVDNGSLDGTKSILKDLLPRFSFARAIYIEKNLGYGNGILSGLHCAKGDILAYTHGDLQSPTGDLFRGMELLEKYPDSLVKGYRQGRSIKSSFFSKGMTLFVFFIFGSWFRDINAQPTIFTQGFFNSWKGAPTDLSFDLFVYLFAKEKHLKVKRFPVFSAPRKHGQSFWKKNPFSEFLLSIHVIKSSFKLKRVFLKC